MTATSEHYRHVRWLQGSKARTSCDGTVFLTRKDRRIHDRQYLYTRIRKRRVSHLSFMGPNDKQPRYTRRAKSVKLEGDAP